MLKTILSYINEFAIKPAGLIAGALFLLSFILLLIKRKNISVVLLKSFLGALLSFITISLLIAYTIRSNDPKWNVLIYPIIFNIWYLIFRKYKYNVIIANLFLLLAFITNYYIVEKIFFE